MPNRTDPSVTQKLTNDMIVALRLRVLNDPGAAPALNPLQTALVTDYDWTEHAPPETLRRIANLDKKLEDLPDEVNIQATRLGNVLRHYEDETGSSAVESLVEEVYDRLPFSLQVAHDEQRGRLDLYCSMVFVWIFVALVTILRFGWTPSHMPYTVAAAALGVFGAWFTYRAAVASARYYGLLLLQIAAFKENEDAATSDLEERPPRTLKNLFGLLERAA